MPASVAGWQGQSREQGPASPRLSLGSAGALPPPEVLPTLEPRTLQLQAPQTFLAVKIKGEPWPASASVSSSVQRPESPPAVRRRPLAFLLCSVFLQLFNSCRVYLVDFIPVCSVHSFLPPLPARSMSSAPANCILSVHACPCAASLLGIWPIPSTFYPHRPPWATLS